MPTGVEWVGIAIVVAVVIGALWLVMWVGSLLFN